MEIRPNVKWDKGHALMYLLNTLGFESFNDVLPMYIGDDRTDEDAFEVRLVKIETSFWLLYCYFFSPFS